MGYSNMSERIRYAWGQSSLGEFIAASSECGLVAFEFGEAREALVNALRARFPAATVSEDDAHLAATVKLLADLVDHPARALDMALDLRGTEYEKQVWKILCEIPAGHTTTYGAVAAAMGTPRDARDVTAAIAANTIAILIPCHRVVKKDGALSGYRWG